jgi:hypothetical protein
VLEIALVSVMKIQTELVYRHRDLLTTRLPPILIPYFGFSFKTPYHFDGVLSVAEEFDTSWFDLNNYEALKKMTIVDWASVIESRANCYEVYDYDAKQEDLDWTLQAMADELKSGYFSVNMLVDGYIKEDYEKEILKHYTFSTSSVDSLRNYQAWDMAKDKDSGLIWSSFQKMRDEWQKPFEDDENHDELLEVAHSPYDFYLKQYLKLDHITSAVNVVIDLYAPDEQIKKDFSHWLKHYREASGCHVQQKLTHKKLFTQKTFDYWIKYGLIPYLDLILIAKIEGKQITQEKLGELIFPDDPIENPEYRIRTITKPEAERLMEEATRWSLMKQAVNEKVVREKSTQNRNSGEFP